MNTLTTISAHLGLILLLSACSSLTPVKPWQKGTLAEPVMNPGGLGYETALHNHVYTSKESPKGGEGVAGGGCGCN